MKSTHEGLKKIEWSPEEYQRRLRLVKKVVEGGYHHDFVLAWRLMNEVMNNTVKDLTRWGNNNNGAVVPNERLKWIMKQNIIVGMSELIVGVANHEPIAELPGQKTKTYSYCNCLAN